MSGVEAAVIALKLFPVVLKAANALFPIVDGAKYWWSFEHEYKKLISRLRDESMFYQRNLRNLVEPLGIDMDDYGSLNHNPNLQLWYDPRIRAQLVASMERQEYELLVDRLKDMNVALENIRQLLTNVKDEVRI